MPTCSWELLHACNYRCPYCFFIPSWRDHAEETNGKHLSCTAGDWVSFWRRIAERHGEFVIEVSGGEPFLYPGFLDLLREVGAGHRLRVITNLSWDGGSAARLDAARVEFVASFHPHFASWPRFCANLQELRRRGFSVFPMMVAYPEFFDELDDHLRRFQDIGAPCTVSPFQGSYGGRPYPESYDARQKEKLRVLRNEPPARFEYAVKDASPLGRLCGSGATYFRAYPDGSIYRCASLKDLAGGRPLGSIKDESFELLPQATPCPADYCVCPVEYIQLEPASRPHAR